MLVDSVERMMMHGFVNPKFITTYFGCPDLPSSGGCRVHKKEYQGREVKWYVFCGPIIYDIMCLTMYDNLTCSRHCYAGILAYLIFYFGTWDVRPRRETIVRVNSRIQVVSLINMNAEHIARIAVQIYLQRHACLLLNF